MSPSLHPQPMTPDQITDLVDRVRRVELSFRQKPGKRGGFSGHHHTKKTKQHLSEVMSGRGRNQYGMWLEK